ncbi:MAG: hypothetical protein NTW96_27530 [Planctomycetia bacterium]|nr:hypothetical protein [Planctomycetia bacterium]
MDRGIAKVDYVQTKGAVVSNSPNWSFIYSKSTLKDAQFALGDRIVLPDGREFRYAKSSAACLSGQGCEFTGTGYVAITAFTVPAAVAAILVSVPAATHAALTADALRGGYAVIYDGTTNNVQFRGIIGNTAADANAAFTLFLDGPLTEAVTTSSKIEVFENPFGAVRTGTSVELAKAGVPAVKITAADTYFWVQVKGPCWIAPQALLTGKQIGGCWRHDGSMDTASAGIDAANAQAANVASQYAGYRILGDYVGNGPLFNLQG